MISRLFFLCLLFSSLSFAEILFEPIGGFTRGLLEDAQDAAPNEVKIESRDKDGFVYGLRLGKVFSIGHEVSTFAKLTLAGEYLTGDLDQGTPKDYAPGITPIPESWNFQQYGVILGLELPYIPRLWVGYIFDYNVDLTASLAPTTINVELEGSGVKYGFGVFLSRYISLNFEYQSIELEQISQSGMGTFNLSSEHDVNTYTVSISFPFSLFSSSFDFDRNLVDYGPRN